MKAMVRTPFGGSDVIEEKELPIPRTQAHEFLGKVHTPSVHPTWRWFS
jgi:hypothetical protein